MRVARLLFALGASVTMACGSESTPDAGTDMAAGNQAANPVRQGRPGSAPGGAVGDAFGTGAAVGSITRSSAAPTAEASAPMPPRGMTTRSGEAGEELPLPGQSIAPTMVIRTGEARVEVDSLEVAIVQLRALAQRLGGFIGNTTMQTGEREVRSATVELKMPAERFDAAQSGLAALGKVEFVNVSAHDVGEEFVDVTARQENARRLEQRLITLLATRTGRLEEVLSVERELARIRETIERYEGRLRYLRTRAAVSTLSVTVHEKEPIVGTLGSGNRITEAFRTAWRNFVGFLALLIESLGVLIPLAIIAAIIARWAWRRRPPRPVPPAAAPPPASTDRG